MKFALQTAVLAQIVCLGAAQFTEPPPTTADPSTITDCTWWFVASASNTCDQVTATYGITKSQLVRYNPVLASSCQFVAGNSYCIEQNWGADPEPGPPATTLTTITTSTTSPVTTTKPGNGIETPQPTQSGMVSNCNKFYFVKSGTACSQVLSENGISLADFVRWNPSVGSTCSGMWAEVNVCVGVVGGGPTTTATTATTTTTARPPVTTTNPGNGIQTPQPTQPDMVGNCNKFHFVAAGSSCSSVLSANGISLADFARWNPSVGSTCSGLWAEVNVCVGVVGGGPTTTARPPPTTTTKPGGVQTPQPTQPGMVTNCKKFHYVSPGNSCSQITSYNRISLANFVKWNTGVGSDCSKMWANTYVCVGV